MTWIRDGRVSITDLATLNVSGDVNFDANVNVNSNLDVNGTTVLSHTNVDGVCRLKSSTYIGPGSLFFESNSVVATPGGGQGGNSVQTYHTTIITCATDADSVQLPSVTTGFTNPVTLKNATANNCAVYPASGENINDLAINAPYNLVAGATQIFNGHHAGTTWYAALGNDLTYYGSAYGFVHDTGLWEDLRFPAAGILKKGPYDPPDDDVDTGSLLFSDSAREAGVVTAQMPHGWKSGTNIEPHLHIISEWGTDPGTGPANLTRWTLEYIIADVGDTIADVNTVGNWTAVNVDANVTAHSGGLPVHQIIDFPEIDMTGYQDSCMAYLRFSRRGDDGTNDTYPDDITLIELDIHYLHHTFGSINEHGEDF